MNYLYLGVLLLIIIAVFFLNYKPTHIHKHHTIVPKYEQVQTLDQIVRKLQVKSPLHMPECASFVEGTVPDKIMQQIDMMNAMFCRHVNRESAKSIILSPLTTDRVAFHQNGSHQYIKYDTFFHNMTLQASVRIHLEWFIENHDGVNMLITDDRETIGYPCKNQWTLPLPDQVSDTGREVYKPTDQKNVPILVYLNYAEIIHSSLILDDLTKCRTNVDNGVDPTSLESIPTKDGQDMPITGSCNYMNKPIKLMTPTSPLKYPENGLFTWNMDGVPVKYIMTDDDHLGTPVSNPTVAGAPAGQTSFNWLFDRSRGAPNTIFT